MDLSTITMQGVEFWFDVDFNIYSNLIWIIWYSDVYKTYDKVVRNFISK